MTAKKRLLSILIAVCMIFALVPMTAGTAYADGGWDTVDGIQYWFDDNGTAIVTGLSGTASETIDIPAAVTYNGKTYGVTGIDGNAFENNTSIKEVKVPEGVTSIGSRAFKRCTALETITLPDTLTEIGVEAFNDTAYYNNDSNWESGALYIGKYLIDGKNVSGSYTVKDKTIFIAKSAFDQNTDLTGITIPASVTGIGVFAFQGCTQLSNVTFGDNSKLTSIGTDAFAECGNLKSIQIPSGVTSIGNGAFINTGLTSIELPEGLTMIDYYLFDGCGALEEVTIPSTVTEIGHFAFDDCTALQTIHFGGSKAQWAAITGGGKPTIAPTDYGKYDITFDARGGSVVESQVVEPGSKAVRPDADPTRNGCEFAGWYTDETLNENFVFDTAINKDTTICEVTPKS